MTESNNDNQPVVEPVDNTPEVAEEPNQSSEQERVDYAKYRELLDEKKKEQKKAREYEAKLKEVEEGKLVEQQRYKELFEARDTELNTLKSELEAKSRSELERMKRDALIREVGGLRRDEYAKFIDMDKIILESDGNLNSESVKEYAKEFKKNFAELIRERSMPSQTPDKAPEVSEPSFNSLSSEEMLKRMKN